MAEIILRYITSKGYQQSECFNTFIPHINLDLRDMARIDLLPLIWCTELETLSIRNNELKHVDLSPLTRCKKLQGLRLDYNKLEAVDLSPLGELPEVREVTLRHNPLKEINLSPLFFCSKLRRLELDEKVTLKGDLLLRSIGSWPEILMDKFHRIKWQAPEELLQE